MERITSAVKQELSRFGAQGGMPELVEAWPEVVGPMVAANAWPARIARDGTLHVNTSSAAWAFELGQLAPEISTKLSRGSARERRVAIRIGHLPGRRRRPWGARTPLPSRSGSLQRAAELAAGSDEELRKKSKAASLGLNRPDDHRF